jgi:hypothetical protein
MAGGLQVSHNAQHALPIAIQLSRTNLSMRCSRRMISFRTGWAS